MTANPAVVLAVVAAAVAVGAGTSTLQASPSSQCVSRGALPDPVCTPGALNAAVTQATIQQTICKSGYSSSIRPPEAVTEPEKYVSMKQYGFPKTDATKIEYDHLVSLELGGAANSPLNLWPELHHVIIDGREEGSFVKDTLEDRLHSLVCDGKVSLVAAQTAIATDWTVAYQQYVGKLPR